MPADVVLRVGRAYGMTADRAVYQAVAVTDGRITAAERSRDDLHSFVQRGGHVGVANSAALRLAGIPATAADPPSGTVVRLADGTPAVELIEAAALDPVRRLLPPVTQAQQADLLARQCQLYNRRG